MQFILDSDWLLNFSTATLFQANRFFTVFSLFLRSGNLYQVEFFSIDFSDLLTTQETLFQVARCPESSKILSQNYFIQLDLRSCHVQILFSPLIQALRLFECYFQNVNTFRLGISSRRLPLYHSELEEN